jgi:hypothetical protein
MTALQVFRGLPETLEIEELGADLFAAPFPSSSPSGFNLDIMGNHAFFQGVNSGNLSTSQLNVFGAYSAGPPETYEKLVIQPLNNGVGGYDIQTKNQAGTVRPLLLNGAPLGGVGVLYGRMWKNAATTVPNGGSGLTIANWATTSGQISNPNLTVTPSGLVIPAKTGFAIVTFQFNLNTWTGAPFTQGKPIAIFFGLSDGASFNPTQLGIVVYVDTAATQTYGFTMMTPYSSATQTTTSVNIFQNQGGTFNISALVVDFMLIPFA